MIEQRWLEGRERWRRPSKIAGGEVGWEPAAARLVSAGADPRRAGEEPRAWLARVLPTFTRLKHPGNHAYVWRLDGVRLPGLPYPRKPVTSVPEYP